MSWHVSRSALEKFAEVNSRRAQELLPDLVGKLIKASIRTKYFKFPAGNDISLPGFDGVLECEIEKNPIPMGKSVWQMSVRRDFKTKFKEDFNGKEAEKDSTYIQVFINEWSNSEDYLKAYQNKGWGQVKVIHGTILIDWIHENLAVHRWLAREIGIRAENSIDAYEGWKIWSRGTEIESNPELVLGDRDENVNQLKNTLIGPPCTINIIGESISDAKAFLFATILRNDELFARFLQITNKDFSLEIFDSSEELIFLVPFFTEAVGFAMSEKKHHIIYLQDKDDSQRAKVKIELVQVSYFTRRVALLEMGLSPDKADNLLENSNNKLEFIRLQPILGPRSEIFLDWMKNPKYQHVLKALILIPNFYHYNEDLKLFADISNTTEPELISLLEHLENEESSPIYKTYVNYRTDSILTIWHAVEKVFFTLEQIQTIYTKIFGFTPNRGMPDIKDYSTIISSSIKEQATESLSFIAHKLRNGNQKFESIVSNIFNVTPLQAIRKHLPSLAEISPELTLSYVESQLRIDQSITVVENLNSNDYTLFNILEMIGQLPLYIGRSCRLLWMIINSQVDPNISNSATEALANILNLRKPHTAASIESRFYLIDEFLQTSSTQAWDLLLALLPSRVITWRSNFKPRWTTWFVGQPQNNKDLIAEKEGELCQKAIDWTVDNPIQRWKQFLEILPLLMDTSFYTSIGNIGEHISKNNTDLEIISVIKSELKTIVQNGKTRVSRNYYLDRDKLHELELLIQSLSTDSLFDYCYYLFHEYKPQLEKLISVSNPRELDYKIKEERLYALKDLYIQTGVKGLEKLVLLLDSSMFLLNTFDQLDEFKTIDNILSWLFSEHNKLNRIGEQLVTWQSTRNSSWIKNNKDSILQLKDNDLMHFLKHCGLSRELLDLIISKSTIENEFWSHRHNFYLHENHYEIINDLIPILLKHNRIVGAIDCLNSAIKDEYNSIDLALVIRVLMVDYKQGLGNKFESYSILTESWISDLIIWLTNKEIDEAIIADIEWIHFRAIESNHNIPTAILRKLSTNPVYFVEFYLKGLLEINHEGIQWSEGIGIKMKLEAIYSMLNEIDEISEILYDTNRIDKFVENARITAEEHGVLDQIDIKLGEFLSFSPEDNEDQLWPSKAIRSILEKNTSSDLQYGFIKGIVNPEPITVKYTSEAYNISNENFEKYQNLAESLNVKFPQTSKLLIQIANHYRT